LNFPLFSASAHFPGLNPISVTPTFARPSLLKKGARLIHEVYPHNCSFTG